MPQPYSLTNVSSSALPPWASSLSLISHSSCGPGSVSAYQTWESQAFHQRASFYHQWKPASAGSGPGWCCRRLSHPADRREDPWPCCCLVSPCRIWKRHQRGHRAVQQTLSLTTIISTASFPLAPDLCCKLPEVLGLLASHRLGILPETAAGMQDSSLSISQLGGGRAVPGSALPTSQLPRLQPHHRGLQLQKRKEGPFPDDSAGWFLFHESYKSKKAVQEASRVRLASGLGP